MGGLIRWHLRHYEGDGAHGGAAGADARPPLRLLWAVADVPGRHCGSVCVISLILLQGQVLSQNILMNKQTNTDITSAPSRARPAGTVPCTVPQIRDTMSSRPLHLTTRRALLCLPRRMLPPPPAAPAMRALHGVARSPRRCCALTAARVSPSRSAHGRTRISPPLVFWLYSDPRAFSRSALAD